MNWFLFSFNLIFILITKFIIFIEQGFSLSHNRLLYLINMFNQFYSGWGIECEILTPQQCQEKCPILSTEDLLGGLWIPKDGVANPTLICETLIEESTKLGVRVIENCGVIEVAQEDGRVSAVKTTKGHLKCEYFVNCGGFWARNIGQMSKPCVKVPLHAVEHYYLHTKPIDGLDSYTPVVRDLDGQIYIRESRGRILGGGFELKAKPAFLDGTIPCKLIDLIKKTIVQTWLQWVCLLIVCCFCI